MYVCVLDHYTKHMCEDQRTSHEGQFSPSTMRIPETEFRLSCMVAITYPMSHHFNPNLSCLHFTFTQHYDYFPRDYYCKSILPNFI